MTSYTYTNSYHCAKDHYQIDDWDEVFSRQINVDSFVGWKLRQEKDFKKLSKALKPLVDVLQEAGVLPDLMVDAVGVSSKEGQNQ